MVSGGTHRSAPQHNATHRDVQFIPVGLNGSPVIRSLPTFNVIFIDGNLWASTSVLNSSIEKSLFTDQCDQISQNFAILVKS